MPDPIPSVGSRVLAPGGRPGVVARIGPETDPAERGRVRDDRGARVARGLGTQLVWVVLDGEGHPTPYWPEMLEEVR